jgi:tetratricopeptide (TPR) repeat protein
MLGYALRTSGRTEQSLHAMDQAIALNPNNPLPYHGLAYGEILLGRAERAQQHLDRALALSPREPLAAVWHWTAGYARLLLGDDAGAAAAARKAVEFNARYPSGQWLLAAAAAHLGRSEEAANALSDYMRLGTDLDTIGKLHAWMSALSPNPTYRAQLQRLPDGLRKAGMAE